MYLDYVSLWRFRSLESFEFHCGNFRIQMMHGNALNPARQDYKPIFEDFDVQFTEQRAPYKAGPALEITLGRM